MIVHLLGGTHPVVHDEPLDRYATRCRTCQAVLTPQIGAQHWHCHACAQAVCPACGFSPPNDDILCRDCRARVGGPKLLLARGDQ